MRSPFAPEPAPDVDVSLEEAALFDTEPMKQRPLPPLPKPSGRAPMMDAEETTQNTVAPELLRALAEMRDSTRLVQAAIDLGKTVEEPAFALPESVRRRQ